MNELSEEFNGGRSTNIQLKVKQWERPSTVELVGENQW